MWPTIAAGDAVVINLLPYYIRTPQYIPFTSIAIPHFDIRGLGSLEQGDIVLFMSPELRRSQEKSTLVKRCAAVPGDTVALVEGVLFVNGQPYSPIERETSSDSLAPKPMDVKKAYRLLRKEQRVVVPYEGYELVLDSVKAEAWKDVLRYEGVNVSYKNNIVFLNNRPATLYRFKYDYFFAVGDNTTDSRDSRHYGFVPTQKSHWTNDVRILVQVEGKSLDSIINTLLPLATDHRL